MFEIFQYSFMVRAFLAGLAISIIAPLIGTFLVARRYSLIADTMGHIALAGVAIGLFLGVSPLLSALVTAVVAALLIDRLRSGGRISGESALALFLSGGLALAVVLISLAHGFTVDLFSYLFGSITTVAKGDLVIMGVLGGTVITVVWIFYKELFYVSFDEDSAKVSGVPTLFINVLLVVLTAITVALSIRIVGTLLIGALMVIPVVTASQIARSFRQTLGISVALSVFTVSFGLVLSYYANLAAGGTIVLVSLVLFGIILAFKRTS